MRFLPQTDGVNALTALINNDHKMKKTRGSLSRAHIAAKTQQPTSITISIIQLAGKRY